VPSVVAAAVLLRGAGTASASAGTRSLLHFWAGAAADTQHRWVESKTAVPHGGDLHVSRSTGSRRATAMCWHTWCKQSALADCCAVCWLCIELCRPPLFSSRRMLLDRSLQAAQGADKTDATNAPSAADQRSRPQPRPSYGPYGNTYPTQGGGSSWGNSNSGSSAWQNAASGSNWGGGWGRRR
jgi:hypothetical protein